MNVWSHLLGAIFFLAMGFYVILYLSPTSLHGETGIAERWLSSEFDQGHFDELFCAKEDFNFPKADVCPYRPNEVLDDLLETSALINWQQNTGKYEIPSMGHVNLNYHGRAFEQVDHYLRHTVQVLSQPPQFFKK